MQVESALRDGSTPAGGIAQTFLQWAQAHRSYGGDYDEKALNEGIQATVAAYSGGHSLSDSFEIGRQAYYRTLR